MISLLGYVRRGAVCLLAATGALWITSESRAQDSVPRGIHSDRTTHSPMPLGEVKEKGVVFPVNITSEVLGNLSGGTTRRAIWESLFIAGMEVDFEKTAGLPGLSLAISGLYAAGPGLTDNAIHDLNVVSNIDTYDSLRLYEAWLQQEFARGQWSIRVGQLLADAEFFVCEGGALFLNSSFGALPLVSQNLVPPIFPVASPGIRFRAAPGDSFYAEAAVFGGDSGDPASNNKHGTRISFRGSDGALAFFEAGYRLHPTTNSKAEAGPAALSGSFKIGGFYHSGEFESHTERRTRRGNYGVYFVVDQEIWHPAGKAARALAFFGRVGVAPDDRNAVPVYFDAGLNFRGVLPSRVDDTLGLGFSYAQLSDGLADDAGNAIGGDYEGVVELTYRLMLGEHVFLQPDLQLVIHPGAVASAAPAVVAGLRVSLSY